MCQETGIKREPLRSISDPKSQADTLLPKTNFHGGRKPGYKHLQYF